MNDNGDAELQVWASHVEAGLREIFPDADTEFPPRDPSKPVQQQGLFQKYVVRRVDGSDHPGGKHHGCRYWVLDLAHDQHAPEAMRAYASACRAAHPHLADAIESEFGRSSAAEQVRLMREASAMLHDSMFQFCDTSDKAHALSKRMDASIKAMGPELVVETSRKA